MTPDEIEQMKADIEAGTPGPWETHKRNDEDEATLVISDKNHIAECSSFITGAPIGVDAANASRIARVPQLEAEVLRLRNALGAAQGLLNPLSGFVKKGDAVNLRHLENVRDEIRAAFNGGTDE